MDTHPTGECCISDCFVSQGFDITHMPAYKGHSL